MSKIVKMAIMAVMRRPSRLTNMVIIGVHGKSRKIVDHP